MIEYIVGFLRKKFQPFVLRAFLLLSLQSNYCVLRNIMLTCIREYIISIICILCITRTYTIKSFRRYIIYYTILLEHVHFFFIL